MKKAVPNPLPTSEVFTIRATRLAVRLRTDPLENPKHPAKINNAVK